MSSGVKRFYDCSVSHPSRQRQVSTPSRQAYHISLWARQLPTSTTQNNTKSPSSHTAVAIQIYPCSAACLPLRHTTPLRSRGSPNKGTKSKVAHKWAELLHHPCVLGGPQTRGQSQRWPTNGQNCYITLAFSFSRVPKQGDKVKGGPQMCRIATSPLRSRGSPNKGTK